MTHWFIALCKLVNIKESLEEEYFRYQKAPNHSLLVKWVNYITKIKTEENPNEF